MTAQRQERNRSRPRATFRPGIAVFAAGASLAWVSLLGTLAGLPRAAEATTTERVVTNRFSGLAIEGFDPVAYFADARPLVGLADFEVSEAGVVWRFRNEGNRASFVAHPDIYGPQFGGYDPIDVARGVAYAGNPLFWLVSGERLFLFGREEHRDAFAADPERFLPEAKLHWPNLEQDLSR